MIQFYAPDIREKCVLGPEESVHCIRVLRRKEGDLIYVADGKGRRYECRILSADTRGVKLEILNVTEIRKSWCYHLTLVVAPTKNADRMAWLVEKCTEIGIDRIIFIECKHSERKNVNIDRLRRNAVSAMNQSLKTWLPEIEGMVRLRDILSLEGNKFFGYCDSETDRKDFARTFAEIAGDKTVIAIGPEGDFSLEEVEALRENGYTAVRFGDERLRTETAAIYGVTAVHVINDLVGADVCNNP